MCGFNLEDKQWNECIYCLSLEAGMPAAAKVGILFVSNLSFRKTVNFSIFPWDVTQFFPSITDQQMPHKHTFFAPAMTAYSE